jgi:hypothetical protein
MIVAKCEEPLVIDEPETTPQERAQALAALEAFRNNVEWFGARAKEIRDAHTGKLICVADEELFVGDDPVDVMTRAKAAHPTSGGFFSLRLSTHRGPKIYAN